jgi:hypothetical protein
MYYSDLSAATAAALTFWPWFFTMLVAGALFKLGVFGR